MKDNTVLHSWDDLKQFGVNPLTGEACAYGRRILCDLSEEGVKLVETYLGLVHPATFTPRMPFAENWNSRVGEAEAVASMLVPRALMPDLMVFALLQVGNYDYVMQSPTGFTGFNRGDRYGEHYLHAELPEGWTLLWNERKRRAGDGSAVGDRNIHQMTGRTL